MPDVLGPPGSPPTSNPAARAPGGPSSLSSQRREVGSVAKFRVLVGINYPVGKQEKRAEVGDVVSDLPAKAVPGLLEQGVIEQVKDKD